MRPWIVVVFDEDAERPLCVMAVEAENTTEATARALRFAGTSRRLILDVSTPGHFLAEPEGTGPLDDSTRWTPERGLEPVE